MREIGWRAFAGSKPKHLLPLAALFRRSNLVCCNRIGFTIAARDFSRRRGASDEHIPKWICQERATKDARKRTAALRVALKLACGVVARRSQPHWRGMLPPRRLATGQFERNDCKANSVTAHQVDGHGPSGRSIG